MKKKIFLISNSLISLTNLRHEFILKLLDNYDVSLVCPLEPQDEMRFKPFKEKGCGLIETSFARRSTNPLSELKLKKLYRRILKKHMPDLVITYTIKCNIYAGMACEKLNIPYMVNITGLGTAFEKNGLLKTISVILYKKALKKCNTIFFQNKQNQKIMEGFGLVRDNAKLVTGSGINTEHFKLLPFPKEGSVGYIFIARIMKAKGADEFLEAASLMKKKYPDSSFTVLGYCEEDYTDKLKKYEDAGVISYKGWQEDSIPFLEKSMALVLPSYHEGLSNVCLEASSCGRAIIASDISGCRETVDNGVTGFLCKKEDVTDLYDKMEQFYLLPYDRKKEMGLKGREKVSREFDRNKVIEVYEQAIEKILG